MDHSRNGEGQSTGALPGRKHRGWIWFFVVLVVLTAAGIWIPLQFNRSQQLTREQLEAARTLWKQNGPPDYDLSFTKQGNATGTFVVQVRLGKVVRAELDGRALEPRLYTTCDMPALFDDIERFLELDSQPNRPRVFAVATFDKADGHLLHYVRSVSALRERVEITVEFRRVSPQSRARPYGRRELSQGLAALPDEVDQPLHVLAEPARRFGAIDRIGTSTVGVQGSVLIPLQRNLVRKAAAQDFPRHDAPSG